MTTWMGPEAVTAWEFLTGTAITESESAGSAGVTCLIAEAAIC